MWRLSASVVLRPQATRMALVLVHDPPYAMKAVVLHLPRLKGAYDIGAGMPSLNFVDPRMRRSGQSDSCHHPISAVRSVAAVDSFYYNFTSSPSHLVFVNFGEFLSGLSLLVASLIENLGLQSKTQ
jgi:hypothetical protein